MTQTELRYHVPLLGHVTARLHEESNRIYQSLLASGEVERLKSLDHLGLMRSAWEGAHHSRWEYTVLILSLIERCKSVSQIHLAGAVPIGKLRVSSGYELMKSWALLLNTGHLTWTFTAERALLLETWANKERGRMPYLSAFPRPPLRDIAQEILQRGHVYRFFQTLTLIRLPGLVETAESRNLCRAVLQGYLRPEGGNGRVARLKSVYRNLRRLAYMALDTRYTPSVVSLDLTQPLTDGDTLARLALRDRTRGTDELDGLGDYLDRETYLGRRVLEEIAARERQLRLLIRQAIRSKTFQETVEELALGALQQQVTPTPTRTILRVSGESAGGLAGYWPRSFSARVEQSKLEREAPSGSVALYWRTAGGTDWVIQSHATNGSPDAIVGSFFVVWKRAVAAHAKARDRFERARWADAYSEKLASTLVQQALPLFFSPLLRWEWGAAGPWGEALLVRRTDARSILQREAESDELPSFRKTEVRMLARTLRQHPREYVAVAFAPLIAYDKTQHVGELDGCFVECDRGSLRVTLVEAKKRASGAKRSAERSLAQCLRRIRPNPNVHIHPQESEAVGGRTARAWVTLEVSA